MEYYLAQSKKLMRGFERLYVDASKPIAQHLESSRHMEIHELARENFKNLILILPYIGGNKASGTKQLVIGAQILAIIRALEYTGIPERSIGEIIYKTFENHFKRIPKLIAMLIGKFLLSSMSLKKRLKILEETQKKAYPEAFVSVHAPCSDGSYDYGQNVFECAIKKFYTTQNALQYLPYFCLGDYAMFRRMGVGFYRTQNLACGGEWCDFRFLRKGKTVSGWPPENLPEWRCMKKEGI